jgi:small subunit ribosomal protein S17
MSTTETTKPKTLSGVVVSTKMQDTIVVAVSRYVKHPKYLKFQKLVKRYHVHAPGATKEVGDMVEIRECRPISKKKHFMLIQNP